VERCRDCGRLTESGLNEDDKCPVCGGELEELRIAIRREPAPPPTSGEELSGRLVGIGA
jgi:hypothetical protein